jgi:hypothetical protein
VIFQRDVAIYRHAALKLSEGGGVVKRARVYAGGLRPWVLLFKRRSEAQQVKLE